MTPFSSNGRKIIAHGLLLIQLFFPLFFSSISIANAVENAEMADTISGIQSLMNDAKESNDNVTKDSVASLSQGEISLFPSERLSSGHYPLEMPPSLEIKANSAETINPILPNLGGTEAPTEDNTDQALASIASQVGNILANRNAIDASIGYAKNIAEGLVNQRLNDWLTQYGSARVSISSDRTFTGDFLLPVIDSINSLLFTQLGLRTNKDRNTLNLGLGYRQYWGDWMYGINTFYDYDYTGGNARLGLGGEAWTDYLKLAANGYFGLTDWHQSKIFIMDDYDERPATGFDVRAEAYLPTYPKLGGSIKYEKYFGKGVHLGTGVDPDKLKDDPYALTLGINYTPIPLITLKGEHAAGDRNDTMVGMDIIYRFGVPLSQQLDPDAVDVMRSLVGNKYDFVDRNYDIVMQYRKQELINISLPAEMRAEAKETLIIPATINKTKYGLKKINWTVSPNFIANGGSYQIISPTQLEIILPAYVYKTQSNAAQEYQISAVGIDNNDNESNRATTIIRVKPSKNVVNDLIVEPNATLPANNQDRFTTTAVITNEHGQPLPQQVITFHVDGLKQPNGQSGVTLFSGTQSASNGKGITATTDNQGKAVIYISSKVAGEGKITATMENGNYKHSSLKFSADRNSAQIAKLTVTRDKALADGKEKNTLYALVTDEHGNTVENMPVVLTATDGAIIDNGGSANTNQRGELIIGVTSTKAGKSEITAEVNGKEEKQSVTFATGRPSAEKSLLTAQPATIVANGKAVANLTLELKDPQGNPISGDKVTFTTSLVNSHINNIKETAKGVYSAELTGTTAGESIIGVKINGSVLKNKTVKVVLIADSENPSPVKSKLEAKPDRIVANGKSVSTLKLTLQDVNGNLIAGQTVKFNTSLANSSIGQVTESSSGIYIAPLTGTKAGKTEISVEVAGKLLTVSPVIVVLAADSGNVSGEKSKLTAVPTTIVANGVATSTVTLVLKDTNDNLIGGQQIDFTSSLANSQITTAKETSEGVYSATLTGTQAGETTIGVKVNGSALNMKEATKVTLIADSTKPGADKSKLAADPNHIVANRTDFSTVKLTLKDVNGNPITGHKAKVRFSTSLANSKFDEIVEENSGVYSAKLTGTMAGETTIGVTVNDVVLNVTPVIITLTADSSKLGADKSKLEANPTRIVANGKAVSTVKLTLKDINGNAIPGLKDKVKFNTSLVNSEIVGVTEESNGVYTAKLTGTTAGETTVGVEVNGKSLNVSQMVKVTLIADSTQPSAEKSNLVANPTSIVADGKISSTITLELKDVNGNPIAGQGVTFEHNLAGSQIGKVTDKGNGVYEALLVGKKAGQATISVGVNGELLVGKKTAVTLIADSSHPGGDHSKLEVEPAMIVANGVDASTLKLTLKDVNGNPIAGQKVEFNSNLKNSHVKEIKDEGKGIYTAKLTGTTAGEASIDVIVNDAVLQIKNTAKVTLTADNSKPGENNSKLEAEPTTIVADGETYSTLRLTLLDVNDNPLAGQKVEFNSNLNNSHAKEIKDEGKGIYTAKLIGTTAGEASIEVKVNDAVLQIKNSAKVTLTADSSKPSLEKSKLTATPLTIVANGKDSATLRLSLVDINANPITGYKGKVKFNTSLEHSKVSEIIEESNGVYTAKLTGTQAGNSNITVKFNELELNFPAAVTVTLTPDSDNPSVEKSKLVADPTTIVADGEKTSNLTLTLMDANNNPITGQKVEFTTNLANSEFDKVKENDKGIYTAKLKGKTAGVTTIKVKVNDKEFAIETKVTLTADSKTAVLKQVTLDGDNTSKVANGSDNFTFTALVKDANDNPVPNITLKWLQNKGNNVTLSNNGESETNAEGKASITLTSTTVTVAGVQVSAKKGDDEAIVADKKVNFYRKFNLNGTVVNAVNGKGIANAEIKLYTSDSNSKAKYEARSDSKGEFTIVDLIEQPYTLKTKAQGFVDYELGINDPEKQLQKIILSPELGDDYARIILSWGPTPKDLDSHLWGDTNTGNRFHVSFSNKKAPDGSAILDIDAREGFGPETITIKKLNPGRYRYAVHNFSKDPAITTSHAKVVVAQKDKNGGTQVSQYDIPTSGEGLWWEVFELDGNTGEIRIIDQITNTEPK
ncbi:Invasin [Arsenophonus nasoniae]|uniref:Invasin n=2 Tax=Arsenophonus nasoniae TaxID=638 RepID=A0A4P7KRJ7_9GAMM|nr:invasin domain 3-containing protein [Arsenophonus nasoniae]QBY42687.1 Invasin [Arsenophonus nasoniae]